MIDAHILQWPAMVVTVVAAWLVASESKAKRQVGFWSFLLSNALWIAWAWHSSAWALALLQVALAFMNVRGAWKNKGQKNRANDPKSSYSGSIQPTSAPPKRDDQPAPRKDRRVVPPEPQSLAPRLAQEVVQTEAALDVGANLEDGTIREPTNRNAA